MQEPCAPVLLRQATLRPLGLQEVLVVPLVGGQAAGCLADPLVVVAPLVPVAVDLLVAGRVEVASVVAEAASVVAAVAVAAVAAESLRISGAGDDLANRI